MRRRHFNLEFREILLLLCILLLSNCNSINGRIEIREGKAFVVNSSKNKKFEFTIKKTQIKNDSVFDYTTQIIKLAPGDEELLGTTDSKSEIKYPTLTRQTCKIYDVINKKVTYNTFDMNSNVLAAIAGGDSVEKFIASLPDTIIEGKKMKYMFTEEEYNDSLHPMPQDIYKYIFQITGQSEFKDL